MGTTILKALLEHHSDSQKLDWEIEQASGPRRVFLLSPVNAAGIRAKMTKTLFAEFKIQYQRDSTPATDSEKNDLRYLLGIGWQF